MTDERATPGGAAMPAELAKILSEEGWWTHPDGDLFVWEVVPGENGPCIRVAFEDGGWWVTCETDGTTQSDIDELVALVICMARIHRAIGTPLGHFVGTFGGLQALAMGERAIVGRGAAEEAGQR